MFKTINGRILSDIWINTRIKILKDFIPFNLIKSSDKILDLGSGEGTYIGDMFEERKCYTVFTDIEPKLVAKMNKKNKMCFDAQDLNKYFNENTFNWIITADMLEHIKDDKSVLKKIYNCLKPTGHALILVPAYKSLYSKHQKDIGHYRRYNRKELIKLLKSLGFNVLKSRYSCSSLFPPLYLTQRFTDETKFYNKDKQTNDKYKRSKLELKIIPLLDILTTVDSKLNLPFGTSIIVLVQKPGLEQTLKSTISEKISETIRTDG